MLQHKLQSTHNEKMYDFLHTKNPSFIDWEITALFYTALHLFEAHISTNKNPKYRDHKHESHSARKKFMRDHFPELYENYHILYTMSFRSRYTVGYDMSNINLNITRNNFDALKNKILQLESNDLDPKHKR